MGKSNTNNEPQEQYIKGYLVLHHKEDANTTGLNSVSGVASYNSYIHIQKQKVSQYCLLQEQTGAIHLHWAIHESNKILKTGAGFHLLTLLVDILEVSCWLPVETRC